MKRITFLAACMLFCACAMAQVNVNDVFTATPPAGAEKLNGEPLQTYLHANFKVTLVPSNNDFTYQANGVIISSWSLKANPQYLKPPDTLQMRGVRGVSRHNIVNLSLIHI